MTLQSPDVKHRWETTKLKKCMSWRTLLRKQKQLEKLKKSLTWRKLSKRLVYLTNIASFLKGQTWKHNEILPAKSSHVWGTYTVFYKDETIIYWVWVYITVNHGIWVYQSGIVEREELVKQQINIAIYTALYYWLLFNYILRSKNIKPNKILLVFPSYIFQVKIHRIL